MSSTVKAEKKKQRETQMSEECIRIPKLSNIYLRRPYFYSSSIYEMDTGTFSTSIFILDAHSPQNR